jgi:arylsulfatase A-like enzyme
MKPNILVCLCDQLRSFEAGCYGNPSIRTPHIDRLASEGVRFETAVTTFPVCMAARSVLLSGQYNRRCTGGIGNVGMTDADGHIFMPQYPDPGRPHLKDLTLPEILQGLGYHTSVIGKWHIHSWPQDVGFNDYLIPRVHHCHTGQSYTQDGGPELIPPVYSVDFEAEKVEEYLRGAARSDQPFFLYYNISPPHCPLSDAPEKYVKMYDPAAIPIRPNVDLEKRLPDQEHWLKIYRWDFRYYNFRLPYTEVLPEGYGLRNVIAEYYGLTTWLDDTLGRMLDVLDRTGLAENTILVFTSDHGDYLGSHGRVQKGDLHEESVRIPLLVRWPAALDRRVVDDRIPGLVDIAPTLLDLIGAEIPAHMHGRSLLPSLQGEAGSFNEAIAACSAVIETGSGVGLRTPTHLYGLAFQPGRRTLADQPHYFFDMQADPYQLRNLAGSGEQAQLAGELDRLLREWDARTPWMPGI